MDVLMFVALIVVGWTTMWFMPKRISGAEMYTACLVTGFTAFVFDACLAEVLGLYHYFNVRTEFRDVLTNVIMTPPFGAVVLNFMPHRLKRWIAYVILWTLISLCVEWLSVKTHFLNYTGWSLRYSIPFYAFGCFMLWMSRYILRHHGPATNRAGAG